MTQHQLSTMTNLRKIGYPCEFVRKSSHGAVIVATQRKLRPGVLLLHITSTGAYVDHDSLEATRRVGRAANTLYSRVAQNAGSWRNG